MSFNTYKELAKRTESIPEEIRISPAALHASLNFLVSAAELGDLIKRAIFYGKMPTAEQMDAVMQTFAEPVQILHALMADGGLDRVDMPDAIPPSCDLANVNIRLLHGALGSFTEAGEKLMALGKQFETGELDRANYAEEVGDSQWYAAIEVDELGIDMERIQRTNIEKLEVRFPEKFSEAKALLRDLRQERGVLEAGVAKF